MVARSAGWVEFCSPQVSRGFARVWPRNEVFGKFGTLAGTLEMRVFSVPNGDCDG